MIKPAKLPAANRTRVLSAVAVETRQRLTQSAGHRLNFFVTRPTHDAEIKGVIIGSHGLKSNAQAQFLTETREGAGGLAEKLAAAGYAVYFADLPSFGTSEGYTKQHFDIDAKQATHALGAMAELAREENPGKPVALYGHSFGGSLVLSQAIRDAIKPVAVVAEAPAVGPTAIQRVALPAAALTTKAGLGSVHVPVLGDFNISDFSDVGSVRSEMRHDPSIVFGVLADNVTFRTSATVHQLMGEFKGAPETWDPQVPLRIAHSTKDKVTHPGSSEALVKSLQNKGVDATFVPYEVPAHNPANSSVADTYAAGVIDWLDAHVK